MLVDGPMHKQKHKQHTHKHTHMHACMQTYMCKNENTMIRKRSADASAGDSIVDYELIIFHNVAARSLVALRSTTHGLKGNFQTFLFLCFQIFILRFLCFCFFFCFFFSFFCRTNAATILCGMFVFVFVFYVLCFCCVLAGSLTVGCLINAQHVAVSLE